MTYLHKFSDQVIALQAELASGYHPELTQLLAQHPHADREEKLALIATHLNIVIDGEFNEAGIDRLCEIFVEKLLYVRVNPHGIIVVKELPKGNQDGLLH